MTPASILQWATLGAQIITTLGVPVANVIRLFREAGGTDEEAQLLIQHWASLTASIEARIAALKAQMGG